ncbi:hypothetical protein Plhal304r1_c001g0002521 [Plasmopara halstedii]
MPETLLRARLLYGAVALSASVFVFSFLQEREEREDEEIESLERPVSTELFFQAMKDMPQLSVQQRLEMRRFWRNLLNKKQKRQFLTDNKESDHTSKMKLMVRDVQVFAQEYKRVFPDIFPEKQVLDAAERAADAADVHPTAWSDIVGSTSSMIVSTGKRLNDIAKDTKDEVQLAMRRTARKVLESALDIVAARLKERVKDPDMPMFLKTNIDLGIEQFMPDVKMEILRKTREVFGQNGSIIKRDQTAKRQNDDDVDVPSGAKSPNIVPVAKRNVSLFCTVRGHILHHLFPHDKTIWRSFKDPYWVLYTCVGLLPIVGQLWWIFLFIIKDKTNEHQLCQFIVGFKVAQFITLGIVHMVLGISMYIKCVMLGSMELCQGETGPALEEVTACFFALQIVLVWAAFFRLPYTARPQEAAVLYRTKSSEIRDKEVLHDAFGNEVHLDRGGYLIKFCGYETVTFVITMAVASLVFWLPFESWQRKQLFYWIRTAYGLLSFPFLVFKVPVLANVLMHTRQMGYNEQGDTVQFAVKKQHE